MIDKRSRSIEWITEAANRIGVHDVALVEKTIRAFIKPAYRRQGAFTYLYGTVRAFAKQEGSTCLRLYVDRSNRQAQECYKKQGMDECHYLMFEETL